MKCTFRRDQLSLCEALNWLSAALTASFTCETFEEPRDASSACGGAAAAATAGRRRAGCNATRGRRVSRRTEQRQTANGGRERLIAYVVLGVGEGAEDTSNFSPTPIRDTSPRVLEQLPFWSDWE